MKQKAAKQVDRTITRMLLSNAFGNAGVQVPPGRLAQPRFDVR